MVISTKITRDPEDGSSKGHGFVSYDNFSSSDAAIGQMNGQFFSGRQIRVEYAVKKDSKG
jgi:splicing factor 3B subunit 4